MFVVLHLYNLFTYYSRYLVICKAPIKIFNQHEDVINGCKNNRCESFRLRSQVVPTLEER